jgi:putative phosphoribosyl transferase
MQFTNRRDAGAQLAARLLDLKDRNPVVLALPRGGVPIGFEIAGALAAPLDLVLVRKIGAPDQPEFAIGAIAEGAERITDAALIAALSVSPAYVEETSEAALREIERRRHAYLGQRQPAPVAGRTAIIVDDGIATGATMLAALRGVRRRGPARLVLAVPVAPPDTLRRLRPEVDDIVCLDAPAHFMAVGQFYQDFEQLSDADVTSLLEQARGFTADTSS